MKKADVGLIILQVKANEEDAIYMKIYKDGTTIRHGVGGLPALGISMMTDVGIARFFDALMEKIPEDVLEQSINKEEPETPNGSLEYILAFYGNSKNGETGERADWAEATGIRIKLDQRTQFNHPIMGLLDGLTMEAAELTNSLYFDAVLLARWKAKSQSLPAATLISQPNTEAGIHTDYEHYVNQMIYSARKWDLAALAADKVYEKDGIDHRCQISASEENFTINFIPVGPTPTPSAHSTPEKPSPQPPPKKKKPWWKF